MACRCCPFSGDLVDGINGCGGGDGELLSERLSPTGALDGPHTLFSP